jgi:hypothetical protein
MDPSFTLTFLLSGGILLLAFGAIWAFWIVERLRGAGAPRLEKSG